MHRYPTLSVIALLAVLTLALGSPAVAAVRSETVEYEVDGTRLVGHLVWDDSATGQRPGVLVVHEWWGLNDHARAQAERLAKAGYVALAVDMYGDGKTTVHPEEAGQWAGAFGSNPELARGRFLAARDLLIAQESVDPERIAAIGYCFGGSVVLGMAEAGVDLDAVVSFHGSLPTGAVEEGAVKAKVLVNHGAADPLVTAEQIQAFQAAMTQAGADWQMNIYGGAMHSFTNRAADGSVMPMLMYDETADRRSWRAMLDLFDEVFE